MRQCMRLPIPEALLEKAENGAERLDFTVSIAILINVWIRYLKILFKSLHNHQPYVDQTSITPSRVDGSMMKTVNF